MGVENANKKFQDFKLECDTELRFEAPETPEETVVLEMLAGSGELFGTELMLRRKYTFKDGAHVAVYTWQGCVLRVTGSPEKVYVARETPMVMYLNTHAVLEQMRRKIDGETSIGPVVMVCGPADVGKSTVCRILLNYAVRVGRKPVYVDTDVGQGSISLPSTLGAMLIDRTASVEEGFIETSPIVYHFGYKTPTPNIDLYMKLNAQLAKTVREQLQNNRKVRSSGMIINTCGFTKGDGYRMLTDFAQSFEVDAIVVLDDERLYNELARDMPPFVKVVFQPKSGGVVSRSIEYRIYSRDKRVHEYFYGKDDQLSPHTLTLDYDQLRIYRIPPNKCTIEPVTPSKDSLLHSVLSVSFAREVNEDTITSATRGFVCVLDVDEKEEKVTLLCPQPDIPEGILLLMDTKYNPEGES